ncbi:hypothetical protein F511_02054 [Dorcoceras hygrometricum]|uniref:Uncharacterized protein n=1 Tax=Dorcoceras hygrometricum TaxID=472368 RepID=A0A2Z7BYC8_9LAMI|nr:hypothetical protein F511_02054 [Dorcoceras hygrometricum]
MEKGTVKPKKKILNLLPRARAAAVSFQNLPFSPGRDRLRAHHNKGFSGPILTSMIPPEARGRSKNFETPEPTSPKVSCMGQIKHRKKMSSSKQKRVSPPRETRPEKPRPAKAELKKKPSGVWKLFASGRKSDASIKYSPPPQHQQQHPSSTAAGTAPGLGQMRKFASSREAFASFDWAPAQIAPEVDRREIEDSDEERGYTDGEDDIIIPFSAPILMGGGGGGGEGSGAAPVEPRKEINLWKRRTMAQPKPIRLNKIR